MTRRSLCLSLVLSLLAGVSFAQPQPSVKFGGGVLLAVDETASTAKVRQGEHEQTYTLAPDAEIQRDGTRLSVADLAKATGYYVTLRYTESGDTRVVDRVKVTERQGTT